MSTIPIEPERLPSEGRFTALADLGFSVFPVLHPDLDRSSNGKRGKRPAVEWSPYQDAHPTATQIEEWDRDRRYFNTAVVTGRVSGIVTLDVDSEDAMREIESRGYALPKTPKVRTARGFHFYFEHPGSAMGNRVALGGITGLDFRGDGGYVIGPGSVHEDGTRYAWEVSPLDVPLAPVPEWVTELHGAAAAPAEPGSENRPQRRDPPPEAAGDPYGRAALAAEVQKVLGAIRPAGPDRPGNRNDTLNRAAFALGQLVGAGRLDRAEVEARLCTASVENGLVADDGEHAVRATIRSGIGAGIREPRQVDSPRVGLNASTAVSVSGDDRKMILIPGEHRAPRDKTIEQGAHDFAGEVLRALRPGALYRWDRIVGEIIGSPGATVFRELTADRVRMYVDRHCRLARWRAPRSKAPEVVYVSCTRDLAGLVLAAAVGSRHVRELRLITHYPVFAGSDFDLVRPGWNAEHGIFYDQPVALRGIEPAPFDVDALFDLLVDFPFRDQASQVNMIGLQITPLIRPVVGTVPIHLVLSSIERTGKGMLIGAVLGHGVLGTTIPSIQLGEREEEREKRITSLILEGATVVHLDNIPGTRVLDSPSLSALTTSPIWKGRTLGVSSMPSLPNTLTVVASANNLRASSEVAKRMVPIWLEPTTDKPEARSDFIHPDIHAYAAEKRRRTLSILLGMVIRWKEQGRPGGKQRLGGFEAWTSAIGGILEVHDLGRPWLSNREEWTEQSDEWGRDAKTLVAAWAERHGTEGVTAKQVLELVRETDTFFSSRGVRKGGSSLHSPGACWGPSAIGPLGSGGFAGRWIQAARPTCTSCRLSIEGGATHATGVPGVSGVAAAVPI